MSDPTPRQAALAGALQLASMNGTPILTSVLTDAAALLAFLEGTAVPAGTKAAAPVAPKKTTGRKPTKTEEDTVRDALEAQRQEAEQEAEGEPETDEPATDEDIPATKEGVQAAIAKLLQANKRKEAIGLLKKFGAASATSVKEKDYAKFVAAAKAELAKGVEEDLTA